MNLLYFLAAKIFYSVGYFHGSYRVQTFFSKRLPLVTGRVRHPLGFSWGVSSRDSLSTYLTSCEAFTTKIVLSQAPNVDTFICVGANRGWYPLAFGSKTKMRGFMPLSATLQYIGILVRIFLRIGINLG